MSKLYLGTFLSICAVSFFALAGIISHPQVELPILQADAVANLYANKLRPFTTDGCSRFPDGIPLLQSTKWQKCCILHDIAYWQGGTADQRTQADQMLRQCVANSGEPTIGEVIYLGVRAGGYAGLPTTWHWGYGWVLDRGYTPLSSDEQQLARQGLLNVVKNIDSLRVRSFPVIRFRETITGDYCVDLAVSEIRERLGHSSFQIVKMRENNQEKPTGFWKTLFIQTNRCPEAFQFTFHLMQPSACTEKMNELVARGRIRLMSNKQPLQCEEN